jgi:hypothetical protein
MFVTQVGVSELRYVTIQRLEAIHAVTGKDFPVSGDAKLRMEWRFLNARMQGVAASFTEGLMDPPC